MPSAGGASVQNQAVLGCRVIYLAPSSNTALCRCSTNQDCTKWTFCPLTSREGCASAAMRVPVGHVVSLLLLPPPPLLVATSPCLQLSYLRPLSCPFFARHLQLPGARRPNGGPGVPPRLLPAEQRHSGRPPNTHRLQLHAGTRNGMCADVGCPGHTGVAG